MGALSGSLSYTRFFVEGDLPPDFKQTFTEAIQEGIFVPLTAESEDEEHQGWCNIDHPLDLDLDEHKIFYNEYLNLALRVDKWRLPGALLKAYCREAERSYLAKNNKERLRRSEKDDIKAVVTGELKPKLLPSMKTIDMSWNLHTGVVRFWNQSGKVCEAFSDLFEDTFGMRIVPDNPYIGALQYALTDKQTERLAEIEATIFHEDVDAATAA